MVVRVNPQNAVPNQFALDAQALKNEQMKYLMDRDMIDNAQKDMGGVMDFFDRSAILKDMQPQQAQLGLPQAPQVQEVGMQEDEILKSGGIVDEATEQSFAEDTQSLADAEPAEMVNGLMKRKAKLDAQGRDSKDTQELIQLAVTNPAQAKLAIGNINQMIQNKNVSRMMARNPAGAQAFLQGIGVTGMDGKTPTGSSEMDKFKLDLLKQQMKSEMDIDKDWQKSEWDIAKTETKDIKKRAGVINSSLKKIEGLASHMTPDGLLPRTAINAGIMSLARMISPGVVTDKDAAAVAGVGTPSQQLYQVFATGIENALGKGDKVAAEKFRKAQIDLERSLDPANPYTFNVEGFKKIAKTVAGAEASTIQAQWNDASSRAQRSGMSKKVYDTNFGGMSSLISSLDELTEDSGGSQGGNSTFTVGESYTDAEGNTAIYQSDGTFKAVQ